MTHKYLESRFNALQSIVEHQGHVLSKITNKLDELIGTINLLFYELIKIDRLESVIEARRKPNDYILELEGKIKKE